jgi:hypothetical protein
MLKDIASGKLVVADPAEKTTWTTKLLTQGVVSDLQGTVQVAGNHNMYSNLQGQISASQPNTQAIPKWARKYLVPPQGRKFLALDIGSAEARAIVAVSLDGKLREAILGDIYEIVSDHIADQAGIIVPRNYIKKLVYGYLYGQTAYGVTETLKEGHLIETPLEGNNVYHAVQGLFQVASSFLDKVADSNNAFLQGRWTDVDVSDKRPAQRRSYVASSMVAAIVKQWAVNLTQMTGEIDIHEIPRDALWLSVPVDVPDGMVLAQGRKALVDAIQQLGFTGFPVDDSKLLTMKKLGE